VQQLRTGKGPALQHLRTGKGPALQHLRTGKGPAFQHLRTGKGPALQQLGTGKGPAVQHLRAETGPFRVGPGGQKRYWRCHWPGCWAARTQAETLRQLPRVSPGMQGRQRTGSFQQGRVQGRRAQAQVRG
jgi:hypothetical protein